MLETVLPVCFQSAETLQARREWRDRFRVMKGETYTQEYYLVRLSFWRRQWHPPQYSCLENPNDGGAWKAVVLGVAEGQI